MRPLARNAAVPAKSPRATNPPQKNSIDPAIQSIAFICGGPPPNKPKSFCAPWNQNRNPTMQQYPELYTAYEWHTIDADAGRVIVYMQNRRDHPGGQGTIDFPGVTILDYAGGGLWRREEDFWAVSTAYRTVEEYAEASKLHDPEHREKRTRLHWGNGPEWTQGGRSYAERPRSR